MSVWADVSRCVNVCVCALLHNLIVEIQLPKRWLELQDM